MVHGPLPAATLLVALQTVPSATATMTPSLPDSLVLELEAPGRVRAGEAVRFTLRMRNQTERTLDLYLRGRTATFDITVATADGEAVWRRLEGEIIPAIVHLRALKPGEQMALSHVWDQETRSQGPVPPGRYVARAQLLTESQPLETPDASFEVLRP